MAGSRALCFQFCLERQSDLFSRVHPVNVFKKYPGQLFLAALIFEAGCSRANSNSATDAAAFSSPSLLTATLTNDDIILHWKNNATVEGGVWIEYTTPGYEFIKLTSFASDANTTSFLHPEVAPQTTFIYHIQPFFGCATKPVEITTGLATNGGPILDDGPIISTNEVSGANSPKCSIRSLQTFARATPVDLTVTLSSPVSVDLHWKDCASDEDGYYLEVGQRPDGKFQACALLPPSITAFRQTHLAPQTKYYFRVRAFFYGKPSDTASVATPVR